MKPLSRPPQKRLTDPGKRFGIARKSRVLPQREIRGGLWRTGQIVAERAADDVFGERKANVVHHDGVDHFMNAKARLR